MNLRPLLPTDPDYAPFGWRWLRGLNALAFAIYVPYILVRGLWDFNDTITARVVYGKSLQAAFLEASGRLPGNLLIVLLGTMTLMIVTMAVINLTEKLSSPWRLASLGAALLGCAFLIRPMAVWVLLAFDSRHPSDGNVPGTPSFRWLDPSNPRVAALILEATAFGCLAAAPIYLRRRHERRVRALRDARLRMLNAESQETAARLQSLQAQIEPHFLFNTLAHIVRLQQVDAERGRWMLQSLSDYMRSALPQVRRADFTLGRELALTRSYVEIQQIRMGDRLRVEIDVPAALTEVRVPPMVVLTLVENAVKHGLGPKAEGGTLRIEASAKGPVLQVAVCDDGVGLQVGAGTGHGLSNVRSRLEAAHGRGAALEIGNRPAGGVRAAVSLPLAPVQAEGSAP